jgi:hypothetical protein
VTTAHGGTGRDAEPATPWPIEQPPVMAADFPGAASRSPAARLPIAATALLLAGCAVASPRSSAFVAQPAVVPHAAWEASPPLGHAADARRRNVRPGDRLEFRDLVVHVGAVQRPTGARPVIELRLERGREREVRRVEEGGAVGWGGYRVALLAAPPPGELGGGFVALEVATLASLPAHVASAAHAGGADMRLRVPHTITHVTLHHTGSAEPLRPHEDPVQRLRALQAWGARDRNWWDVPYHFLIDLSGTIYEGRDWRFTGETNTGYDPAGHLLISVIGNYELQQPTPAQLAAIADLMAWALDRFALSPDRIGGHYDHAETLCPGRHLRALLEDGTLLRMVAQRRAR